MIIFPPTPLQVDLSNNTCTLELLPCYSYTNKIQVFPSGYDIEGITFQNLDKTIFERVTLYIGNGIEINYNNDEFNNIILPEGGILASRILHHKFGIRFKIKEEYIQNISKYKQVDEYEEIEQVSEEIITFKTLDGKTYEGRSYKIIRRPTGKKVHVLEEYPTIVIPSIEFKVKKTEATSIDTVYTTMYWQPFTIDPIQFPTSYVKKVRNEYCFTPNNPAIDIDTYIQDGKQITGKIKVIITYKDGYVFKH